MQIITEAIRLVISAMAVSAVAMTVTRAVITAPFRKWVKGKSEFFGELVSCPYCASHWGSIIAVLLVRPHPVDVLFVFEPRLVAAVLSVLVTYGFSVFAMVTFAAIFAWLIFQVYSHMPAVK